MNIQEVMDENKRPMFKVTTPKANIEFEVKKVEGNTSFYKVFVSKGSVAEELAGVYTTPDKGLKALKAYINGMKTTKTVERDEKYKRNHSQDAVQPDDKE